MIIKQFLYAKNKSSWDEFEWMLGIQCSLKFSQSIFFGLTHCAHICSIEKTSPN